MTNQTELKKALQWAQADEYLMQTAEFRVIFDAAQLWADLNGKRGIIMGKRPLDCQGLTDNKGKINGI